MTSVGILEVTDANRVSGESSNLHALTGAASKPPAISAVQHRAGRPFRYQPGRAFPGQRHPSVTQRRMLSPRHHGTDSKEEVQRHCSRNPDLLTRCS